MSEIKKIKKEKTCRRKKTGLKTDISLAERILDTVETIIVALDKDGNITLVNRKCCEILGYLEKELIGKNWFTFCLPKADDKQNVKSDFQKIIESNLTELEFFENEVLQKSGTTRYIAWHNTYIRDKEGNIAGTLSAGADITENRRAEKKLKEDELLLRALIDTLPIYISAVDNNGNYIVANRMYSEAFGKSIKDIEGSHYSKILPPYMDEKHKTLISECLKGNIIPFFDEHPLDSGLYHYTKGLYAPLYAEDGKIRGAVVGVMDISDQKELENALRESKERFKTLIENAPIAIVVSRDEQILYGNIECLQLFLIKSVDELSRMSLLSLFVPEVRDKISDNVRRRALGERIPTNYESICMRNDGTRFLVNVVLTRVQYEDNIATLSFLLDITRQKQAEETLKRYQDFLKNLSFSDGLTGIANRRRFDQFLEREWIYAYNNRTPLAILMMDIDFFKAFNDNYGHVAGDDCLRKVAMSLSECLRRPGDIVARYGGEEFTCVLPDTDVDGALSVAKQISAKMDSLNIPHLFSSAADHVTLSIGVAAIIPSENQPSSDLIERADRLLYTAKQSGRNQIRFKID